MPLSCSCSGHAAGPTGAHWVTDKTSRGRSRDSRGQDVLIISRAGAKGLREWALQIASVAPSYRYLAALRMLRITQQHAPGFPPLEQRFGRTCTTLRNSLRNWKRASCPWPCECPHWWPRECPRSGLVWSGVRLLAELLPSGAGKDLTAKTAKALLATVRPLDVAGRTRSAGGGARRRRDRADAQITTVDAQLADRRHRDQPDRHKGVGVVTAALILASQSRRGIAPAGGWRALHPHPRGHLALTQPSGPGRR